MSARVRIDRQSPDVYSAMNRVVKVVREQAMAAGLDRALLELVNMRASQINGCETCLDAHWRAGTAAGLTPQKLALLPAWRDSQLYDDRNIGESDNPNVAMGYLPPQVTAILHRLRDPAVA